MRRVGDPLVRFGTGVESGKRGSNAVRPVTCLSHRL